MSEEQKQYSIAIIGSPDAVLGFKALGVDALGIKTKEEAEDVLAESYASEKYAIIFITEDWYDTIRKTINELPVQALPALVAIPSQAGSTGAGLANLKRIVEKAVGSDILSDR
jgi:V/A-type H+-transporting ATPase subunit F